MIQGPSNGQFEDFQHFVAYVWQSNDWLNALIPVSEFEGMNGLHMYGINHITDEDLIRNTRNYAVIDDLTSSNLIDGVVKVSRWPHRVSVYTDNRDKARTALKQLLDGLREYGGANTGFGSTCTVKHNSIRQFQSSNHQAASVVLQPSLKS